MGNGFGLRCSGDTVTWILRFRVKGDTKTCRMRLGSWSGGKATKFRERSDAYYHTAQAGFDPRIETRPTSKTFEETARGFAKDAAPSFEWYVGRLIRDFGKHPVLDITTPELVRWFRKRSRTPITANRELVTLQMILDGEFQEYQNPARSKVLKPAGDKGETASEEKKAVS